MQGAYSTSLSRLAGHTIPAKFNASFMSLVMLTLLYRQVSGKNSQYFTVHLDFSYSQKGSIQQLQSHDQYLKIQKAQFGDFTKNWELSKDQQTNKHQDFLLLMQNVMQCDERDERFTASWRTFCVGSRAAGLKFNIRCNDVIAAKPIFELKQEIF